MADLIQKIGFFIYKIKFLKEINAKIIGNNSPLCFFEHVKNCKQIIEKNSTRINDVIDYDGCFRRQ